MPARVAKGRTITATQKSNLEVGKIIWGVAGTLGRPLMWRERSSGDGDALEDGFDDFANAQAFNLKFGAEDEPMFENRDGHGLDVVGCDEVASAQSRQRAAGVQERLGGAWTGSDENALVLAR